MFKAQCGSRCVLRCSRLNAALVDFIGVRSEMRKRNFCKDCRKPIALDAKRCFHCGSFQSGVSRHNTNIALFSALLVACLTLVAAKPVWDYVNERKAEIHLTQLECGEIDHYCFLVSNKGNSDAFLTEAYLTTASKPDTTYILNHDQKHKIVESGKALKVISKISNEAPPMIPYELQFDVKGIEFPKLCSVELKYIQVSGVEDSVFKKFSCFDDGVFKPSSKNN